MFHVELRQFPNLARAFNLHREELMARLVVPWVSGAAVEWDDRRWDPEKARITIYESRALATSEIGLGRGWSSVTRTGAEVTERLLNEARVPPALESFKHEIAERCADGRPIGLGSLLELASERHPEVRLSERVALVEQAVWQLLHEQRVQLRRDGERLTRDDWGPALLRWEAWSGRAVRLARP